MLKLLGLGVLIYALIASAGFILVGFILLGVVVKQKIFKMTEEEWHAYFNSLTEKKLLLSGFILYMSALILMSCMGYFIFRAFAFENLIFLSILTFVLGVVKILWEYKKKGGELLSKLRGLRSRV